MNKIILVTGGARSGKSAFAEKLSEQVAKKAYIATAQIFDEEMAHRIKLHKMRRGDSWQTFESPFSAENAINEAAKSHNLILFDCLTVYLSNIICQFEQLEDISAINAAVNESVNRLIEAARNFTGTIIFVTNEVGSGIVPENKLARIFRDCAGFANQTFANAADEVYLLVSGISLKIK